MTFKHFLFSLISGLLLVSFPNIAAEKILRYTAHEPYGGMRTQLIKEVLFAEIGKESQGRLKIEPHWNGEIAISYDALATISDGSKADMGIVVPEYTAKQLPLHQIFKSFAVGPEHGASQVEFFRRVYAEIPELNAEIERNNVVNLQFFLGYPVGFFSTKPIMKLTALQGTSWRTASFWHRAYLVNTGAKTVTLPWNEQITTALRDGKLDGLMVNLDSGYDIHAERAAPNVLLSPSLWLGHVYLLTMNKHTWESLSTQDREAIQRAAITTQKALGQALDNNLINMVKTLEQEGTHVRYLTKAELETWRKAIGYQQEQAQWVAKQKAEGIDNAREVMQKVANLLDRTIH
ncbi:TRAP transporter substrate-binding protein DctP [Escherichia marmotae]|uniref:Bacterial extracellular solute-binding protein, family 7 n=1 Tax=Escherichia marmotae TaxID=1499973 RepID=A0A370V2N1_9ESCH|nr:TRAP transporter substrate-binding protein DctP [Escherichia marmotae]RDR22912.1 Bacterial extracellular solute-binding protein, family 7 [Escherichia marmotae]RDR31619.1 Bacterial extracellular solute-binding protein, family 7 [Escherichia marmotae]RDR38751.1 Bacterial extracellular solute-binding protein, family 7 [Escherichia marmotae]RDR84148.1 Bacterial extracellular solute-binding protein, family 7 [Escherichia marmotae]RDS10007.1 Bacterial extracellular solute-binding protein, family